MYENERWKDIPGFEGLYQISDYGRVKALTRTLSHKIHGSWTIKEKILKPSLNGKGQNNYNTGKGYLFVVLFDRNKKTHNVRIHRLVAENFVSNPNINIYTQVDHIDCNKLNNYYKNLEWVTPLENTRRALKNGLIPAKSTNKEYCMKKIICIETGQVFNSVKEAALFNGIAPTNMSQACKHNWCSKGKHFKYLEKENYNE